jgi:hypothetical protein
MSQEWKPGTVFLKTTDKEGRETFTTHNCWNADLFVKTCHQSAVDAGGRAEQITEEDYAKRYRR